MVTPSRHALAFAEFNAALLTEPARLADEATAGVKFVATAIRKRTDTGQSQLLELVVKSCGFPNWHAFVRACTQLHELDKSFAGGASWSGDREGLYAKFGPVLPLMAVQGSCNVSGPLGLLRKQFVLEFSYVTGLPDVFIDDVLNRFSQVVADAVRDKRIFVVEIPHQQQTSAWSATDEEDFCRRIDEAAARSGATIYDSLTVRELGLQFASADETVPARYFSRKDEMREFSPGDITHWLNGLRGYPRALAFDQVRDGQVHTVRATGATPAVVEDGRYVLLDEERMPNQVELAEEAPFVLDLAQKHGWETHLYRADAISDGEYRVAPISRMEAYVAFLGSDLSNLYIFRGAAEAIAGLEEIYGHGSAGAIDKLRKLLQENGDLASDEDD